jgi:chemotaxis protein MotB
MLRRTRIVLLGLLAAVPLVASGCVPQDKYDQLLMANRSLQEQIVTLEDERDSCRASLDSIRQQLSLSGDELDRLRSNTGRLGSDFDSMEKNYRELLARVAGLPIGALPEDLTARLDALAKAHPSVLTFDPRLGMLRFASDFTFDLGSAELKSEAQQTIRMLAEILNSADGQDFEVRVVGHTDNVRISAGTAQRHPTNMHLAAHRAISVRDALVAGGVSAARFQIAGYGEFRPVVANGPRGATENRRVEIFLAPMPLAMEPPPSAATAPTDSPTEPMK